MRGLWTALITPFTQGNGRDNPVDYAALQLLLEKQIEAGVTGVLLLGTTAENPTLSPEESKKIVEFSLGIIQGKIKLMVNVGTYSTKNSLENIELFDAIEGIDAYLLVNPYYNKPTQTGLFLHFTTLAHATNRNVLLYNIKGRTAVNLETATLLKIISECKNIIGIKEASGDLNQIREVREKTSRDFLVFSGDDGLTYEVCHMGGDGVISVASNCLPQEMQKYVSLCLERSSEASAENEKYKSLFSYLFLQTNPLPTKTYLADKGWIQETFRLPLCPMDAPEREKFLQFIHENNF